MKANNPLVAALDSKNKPTPTVRTLELSQDEVGAGKPGPVSFCVRGYLKPVSDGRYTLDVLMVEPEQETDEMPEMVRTQDSPSPGAA